jgi:hypothetical protein
MTVGTFTCEACGQIFESDQDLKHHLLYAREVEELDEEDEQEFDVLDSEDEETAA